MDERLVLFSVKSSSSVTFAKYSLNILAILMSSLMISLFQRK